MGELHTGDIESTVHMEASRGPFPVLNATEPYWRTELHPIDEYRSTPELPSECDIAIIGTGMSGVLTAWHILEQHSEAQAASGNAEKNHTPSIVLLDARQVCSGATARNGGHSKARALTAFNLLRIHGPQATSQIFAFFRAQVVALKDIVDREQLDCEFELRRSFDVFLDEDEAKEMEAKFKACAAEGMAWTKDYDYISPKFVEQVTSIRGAKAAFSSPACSLWPYKFTTQLLSRMIDRGQVNIQTWTPVTRVTVPASGNGNVLHTPRGTIFADKLIFATNAYTAGLSQPYDGIIVPYLGANSHLSPKEPISPHLTHTYNISYSRGRVDYLNPRPDGGIVVGGANWTFKSDRDAWYNAWDDSKQFDMAAPHFNSLMQTYFRGWESSGSRLDMLWSGVQGETPDSLPHVGRVPGQEGRQWILAGFNGGGMAQIPLCAKGLAHMVLNGKAGFSETGIPPQFETTRQRLSRSN